MTMTKKFRLLDGYHFIRKCGVRRRGIALPVLYAFLAAICEAASVTLLIPAVAVLSTSFQSERNIPESLRNLLARFPGEFTIYSSSAGLLAFIVCLVVVLGCLKALFEYLSSIQCSALLHEFAHNLRMKIANKYACFGKLFFDSKGQAPLLQMSTSHIGTLSRGIESLNGTLVALLILIFYMVIMLNISATLTLVSLSLFPLLHLTTNFLNSKLRKTSLKCSQEQGKLSVMLGEFITGMSLFHAYGAVKRELDDLLKQSNVTKNTIISLDKQNALVLPMLEVLSLIFAAMLLFVFYLSSASFGEYFLGSFAVLILMLKRSIHYFGVISRGRVGLASMHGIILELYDLLKSSDEFIVPSGSLKLMSVSKCIQLKDLSFSYPKRAIVLQNVCCSFEAGSKTALIGPTGSGKSTIVSLLMRYYDCPPNSIFIDGVDIRAFDIDSVRSKFAYISQDGAILGRTIRENLSLGSASNLTDAALLDALDKAQLSELVHRLPAGLDTPVGERGVLLSGGERQRLAIARAIIRNAEILILDEATSALDYETETMVRNALAQISSAKTIIAIAHRFSAVSDAKHVIVLQRGQVVNQGELSKLKYLGVELGGE